MSSRNLRIAVILIVVGVLGFLVVNILSYPVITYEYAGFMYTKPAGFKSNGERIYFTATSDSGKPILATMGVMTMQSGMMSCASCHGADGKGGYVRMMMWSFKAPDIRYTTLTTEGHGEHGNETPYTDELIKRAITQGIDSEGKRLDPPMPVWQMSEEDLNDLIEYLKTLK